MSSSQADGLAFNPERRRYPEALCSVPQRLQETSHWPCQREVGAPQVQALVHVGSSCMVVVPLLDSAGGIAQLFSGFGRAREGFLQRLGAVGGPALGQGLEIQHDDNTGRQERFLWMRG